MRRASCVADGSPRGVGAEGGSRPPRRRGTSGRGARVRVDSAAEVLRARRASPRRPSARPRRPRSSAAIAARRGGPRSSATRSAFVVGGSARSPRGSADDVVDGPERPRREQRFAGPHTTRTSCSWRDGERADERRLSDARLAADEGDAPGAETRALEVGVELRAAPRPARGAVVVLTARAPRTDPARDSGSSQARRR